MINLKNILKLILQITLFVVYFLFSQVYPFVHFHTHYSGNSVKLVTVFHPVEKCHIADKSNSEYNDQSECHRHHQNNSQHFRGDWNAVVVKEAPRLHFYETSLPTAATIFNPSDRVSAFHSIDRNLRIPFGIIYEHTNKSPPLSLI